MWFDELVFSILFFTPGEDEAPLYAFDFSSGFRTAEEIEEAAQKSGNG